MCPALADGNENYAQLLKDKTALQHAFQFSQQNIFFIFIFLFHFYHYECLQLVQLGQVFLQVLFAFLFLLQQIKKYLPNKNQLKNYSDIIYLFLN